jgi:MFS family permease
MGPFYSFSFYRWYRGGSFFGCWSHVYFRNRTGGNTCRLAGSFQVNIVLGILIAFLTNFFLRGLGDDAWRWMLGIMVVPAGVFALLVRTIPESPRWLVLKGRDTEAMKVFEKTGEPDSINLVKRNMNYQNKGRQRNYSAENSTSLFFMLCCWPCSINCQV